MTDKANFKNIIKFRKYQVMFDKKAAIFFSQSESMQADELRHKKQDKEKLEMIENE